jgi:hypothetical protein
LNDLVSPLTEPPLIFQFSTKTLQHLLKTKEIIKFENIPYNTQAVERMVKLVTEASSKVFGHDRRNYFILNALKSRSMQ